MLDLILYPISAFYLIILAIGLVQCKRKKFRHGYYFFMILLWLQLYHTAGAIVFPILLESRGLMGNMEYFMWLNVLTQSMEVGAYGILVYGLYKKWIRPFRKGRSS